MKCLKVDREAGDDCFLPRKLLTVSLSQAVQDMATSSASTHADTSAKTSFSSIDEKIIATTNPGTLTSKPAGAGVSSQTLGDVSQECVNGSTLKGINCTTTEKSCTHNGSSGSQQNSIVNGLDDPQTVPVPAASAWEQRQQAAMVDIAVKLFPYVLSTATMRLWSFSLPSPDHDKTFVSPTIYSNSSDSGGGGDDSTKDEPPAKKQRQEQELEQIQDQRDHQKEAKLKGTMELQQQSLTSALLEQPAACLHGVVAGGSFLPASESVAEALLSSVDQFDVAQRKDSYGRHIGGIWTATLPPSSVAFRSLMLRQNRHSWLPVASIDCEMCQTQRGLQLARVSIIDGNGTVVLDTLVKPELPIVNYWTQFSGVTQESLRDVTVSFAQVRVALLRLISAETVLVGHSINSDLDVLRLYHARCVDTALLYPHPRGFPYRQKLKRLAEDYLNMRIQTGKGTSTTAVVTGSGAAGTSTGVIAAAAVPGHDSVEDAKAALNLALLKAEKGPMFGVKDAEGERVPLAGLFPADRTQTLLAWHHASCADDATALFLRNPAGFRNTNNLPNSASNSNSNSISDKVGDNENSPDVVVAVEAAVPEATGGATYQNRRYMMESCVGGNAVSYQPGECILDMGAAEDTGGTGDTGSAASAVMHRAITFLTRSKNVGGVGGLYTGCDGEGAKESHQPQAVCREPTGGGVGRGYKDDDYIHIPTLVNSSHPIHSWVEVTGGTNKPSPEGVDTTGAGAGSEGATPGHNAVESTTTTAVASLHLGEIFVPKMKLCYAGVDFHSLLPTQSQQPQQQQPQQEETEQGLLDAMTSSWSSTSGTSNVAASTLSALIQTHFACLRKSNIVDDDKISHDDDGSGANSGSGCNSGVVGDKGGTGPLIGTEKTLLIITAQKSMSPLQQLVRQKRALSKVQSNAMSVSAVTAVWSREQEAQLRQLRKDLGYAYVRAVVL